MNDPTKLIADGRMGLFQIAAVAICVVLNALDGFDVLSIAFASNGISKEFGIGQGAALGTILAAELFGMSIGSVALGRVADSIGRRPTMIGCLILMAGGMAAVTIVSSTNELLVYRVITGLGIGGMLACTTAMVSEYSNTTNKSLCVMLMAAGYPLGTVFGGIALRQLGVDMVEDWRQIFVFGAIATAIMLPVIILFLPESVSHLNEKRPSGALDKINRTLTRMGLNNISELPERCAAREKSQGYAALFSDGMAIKTTLLTLAYFAHVMTFYFILKWIPKLVAGMNVEDPTLNANPGDVLVWASIGGAVGSIVLGLLSTRLNLWRLSFFVLIGSFIMVTYFGQDHSSVGYLTAVAIIAGFFTNAGMVALYAMFAVIFPPKSRAGGTGFVIGVGRGGAALSPIVGGALLGMGIELSIVSAAMGAGSIIALIALIWLYQIVKRSPEVEA